MTEQESWEETPDDVITTGSNQVMSHQERYEFVKNRTYYPVKPSEMVIFDKDADAIYIYLKDSKAVESRVSDAISHAVIVDFLIKIVSGKADQKRGYRNLAAFPA